MIKKGFVFWMISVALSMTAYAYRSQITTFLIAKSHLGRSIIVGFAVDNFTQSSHVSKDQRQELKKLLNEIEPKYLEALIKNPKSFSNGDNIFVQEFANTPYGKRLIELQGEIESNRPEYEWNH